MRCLIATIAADGVPRVASGAVHATPIDAWAAIFAFDPQAGAWWATLSNEWPSEIKGPYSDSVVQGSVYRWTLVVVPE